jgi:hypothetical protein
MLDYLSFSLMYNLLSTAITCILRLSTHVMAVLVFPYACKIRKLHVFQMCLEQHVKYREVLVISESGLNI